METFLTFHAKTSMLYVVRTIFDSVYTLTCVCVLASVPQVSMTMHPIWLFVICTLVAIFGGQASLWKGDQEITRRVIVSHLLNMGTCGAATSMLLYAMLNPMENLEWYIIGVIGILSLGGMKMIDTMSELATWALERVSGRAKDEDK